MLGCEIADPAGVEEGGQIRGMELLPVRTVLQKEKHRCQIDGNWKRWKAFSPDLRDMSSPDMRFIWGRRCIVGKTASGALPARTMP